MDRIRTGACSAFGPPMLAAPQRALAFAAQAVEALLPRCSGHAPLQLPCRHTCLHPPWPAQTAYTVARTMFETAGLPEHLAQHVAAMDEIWVGGL